MYNIEQIADIETMHALIRHIERVGPDVPVEVYSRGIGTIALLSLGFPRNEHREEKNQNLYRQSINRLRDSGLIKFTRYERPGVMEARMLPTYAGYEWFEQKMPGKYMEIVVEFNQQSRTMSTPVITALERIKIIHTGPEGEKAIQKLACRRPFS